MSLLKSVVAFGVGGAAVFYGGGWLTASPGGPSGPIPSTDPSPRTVTRGATVCTGRVEPVFGEVDVALEIPGRLAEVRVNDGDAVHEGDVLAVLEAKREAAELRVAEANVTLARSRLEQILAGNGREEIDQARLEVESTEAQLAYESSHCGRMRRLHEKLAVSRDDYEFQEKKVEQLQRQSGSLRMKYEAMRRGALPEQIAVARAELALAESRQRRAAVEHDLRILRAPSSGTILAVYRHAGDSVGGDRGPILRMANPNRLRIRLEVDEASVAHLKAGQEGTFEIRGVPGMTARMVVTTIIPAFGPKRLFDPDTSARHDTRTLAVLCEPKESGVPLYSGQRVTAFLGTAPTVAMERSR